jgi:hypothetical protein
VTFTKPPKSVFTFTAPPNTKVTNKDLSQAEQESHAAPPANGQKSLLGNNSEPTIIGQGWTSIVKLTGVDLTGSDATRGQSAQALMRSLSPVSGPYGSGRVLKTSLVSVLLLDDGTAYIGAVQPAMLEEAATTAAARGK